MIEQELRDAYQTVFDTPAGRKVLKHLESTAFASKIDRHNPNPQAALYQSAQLAMIRQIKRMLSKEQQDE